MCGYAVDQSILLCLRDKASFQFVRSFDARKNLLTTNALEPMNILESLKSVSDCNDADISAILEVLEGKDYGYGRNDEATGSFMKLDATQMGLNEKRKNIVKAAVQAASGQGMAAVICTSLLAMCMIQLQPLFLCWKHVKSLERCI